MHDKTASIGNGPHIPKESSIIKVGRVYKAFQIDESEDNPSIF